MEAERESQRSGATGLRSGTQRNFTKRSMLMRMENWGGSAAYERYMGRWSRLVARRYLRDLSSSAGLAWLDIGCGTGALTEAIVAGCEPRHVIGIDRSEGFLRAIHAASADHPVHVVAASADSLPIESAIVDIAVSGLALNFMAGPDAVIQEWRRVVRADGVISAYVWDYSDGMEFIRVFWDAAASLDPSAAALDEGRRFPLCSPGSLARLFDSNGLRDISVWPVEVPTEFSSFDDYWSPFLAGQGPAPTYVSSLSEEAAVALRESIRGKLNDGGDGPIRMVARAWSVRGVN